MADLAVLGIEFQARGAEQAVRALDQVAQKAGMAEGATDDLAAAQIRSRKASDDLAGGVGRASSAAQEMAAQIARAESEMVELHRSQTALAGSTRQLGAAAKSASVDLASMYDAYETNFAAQYAAGMNGVARSTKLASFELLYFGRQLGDVATMAAMGASPLMILTTQGAQVAEGFALVGQRGVTVTQVLRQMAVQVGGLLATVAPFALAVAAVAGPLLLWRKHLQDVEAALAAVERAQVSQAEGLMSATDALMKAVDFTDRYGLENEGLTRALDNVIAAQSEAYRETMAGIEATDKAAQAAARRAAMEQLLAKNTLLAAAADAEKRAGEAQKDFRAARRTAAIDGALSANWRLNAEMPGAVDGLSVLEGEIARRSRELGVDELEKYWREEDKLAEALMASAMGLDGVNAAAAAAAQAVQSYSVSSSRSAGAAATATQAIDEQARAYADLLERLKTPAEKELERVTADMRTLGKEFQEGRLSVEQYRDQMDRLWKPMPPQVRAVTEELVTLNEEAKRIPSALDDWLDKMNEIIRAYGEAQWATETLYRGLQEKDWGQALAGLVRVIEQVKKAFGEAGTMADKIGAVAGIANVAGQAIGGKGGSALSGAASGAMAGFTLGGPVGAAIGAALGGLGGILGYDSQRKQEKAQQEAADIARTLAAAQEQANRQAALEIELLRMSGDEAGALAKERERELSAMDRTSAAIQRQIYALQDWQASVAKAEAALATAEIQLRTAFDAEMARLQKVIDDADVAGKRSQLEQAYQRERSAIEAAVEGVDALVQSLGAFRRELDLNPLAMSSPLANRDAALTQFRSAAPSDLIGAGRTFLDASASSARTMQEFQRDRALVARAIEQAAATGQAQLSEADRQLEALNRQVAGILAVNDNTISVEEAIRQLATAEQIAEQAAADQELMRAQFNALLKIDASIMSWADAVNNFAAATQALADAQNAKPTGGPQAPTYEAVGWEGYVQRNPDLAALYASGEGMARGRSLVEFAQYHWSRYGAGEDRYFRPFAQGGAFAGGVVNAPTAFPMGEMAEAGPEAIMPLANVGGRLGVIAANDGLRDELRALSARMDRLIAVTEQTARNTGDARDVLEGAARGQLSLSTEAA